ncbi:hypothetical protein NSPZN2_50269 [Nitrospira defluvii]|uniref:Uncharacterized protein n=1 Tax=Nitrospira defluvii TaxID=330214 RepID=A0ABN7MBK9_9BACT|nr:hypothetical protein NSPZN2_50269 [Nitrospira defluvii]
MIAARVLPYGTLLLRPIVPAPDLDIGDIAGHGIRASCTS